MAARASMADLIGRLRRMIGDPAASAVWTDEELQDALDARRRDVRYEQLTVAETVQPGGQVVWLDWWAQDGDWESDAKLYGPTYAELTPATSDYLTGHWTFAAHQAGPVYVVGKTYDMPGAAADVLEEWAGRARTTVTDWRDMVQALQASAARFRERQRAAVTRAARSDMTTASLVRSDTW